MGIDGKWYEGARRLATGRRNLITDVEGVTVGHCTLSSGNVQTGVTAVLPHGGEIFRDKVMAACNVINGFGKSMGLMQIAELGAIETPIVLTNTLSAGTSYTAVVRRMLEQYPEIGDTTGTLNPVVCECNDGNINDIRGLHVEESHVYKALDACSASFAEGAVGAGRGMTCHGHSGGIGSSSRLVEAEGGVYNLGALVMTNHGRRDDLTILGDPVGRRLPPEEEQEKDLGSCIVLLATDGPMSERQLGRLCRRAVVGLSRTGAWVGNGSGELAIAFTTANHLPHAEGIRNLTMVSDQAMDGFFHAVAEAVEEAVLSSMFHAEAVSGREKRVLCSLPEVLASMGESRYR